MPTFSYNAKDKEANTVSGKIIAANEDEAFEKIMQKGLTPVVIKEGTLEDKRGHSLAIRRIRSRDILFFSRQLATMIKAGVPILRALRLLAEQEKNANFKKVLLSCCDGIRNGRPLSECLADYPNVFSPFYIAMIRVGEEGGNLKGVLNSLAEYQQQQEAIYSKVRMALAYPLLMLLVGTATVIFILTYIMPKITQLFSTMSQELPLITQWLIAISHALRVGWPWIIIGILFLWGGAQRWIRTQNGQWVVSRILLHIPLIGPLVLKADLTRFTRTLSLLLKSGIPVIRAVRITLPVLHNQVIKEDLMRIEKDLEAGLSLGTSLKESALVPDIVANIISVGEEAGTLETTLEDVAQTYEQQTGEAVKTAMTLLEPLMILAIGCIVGIIVIAMLLPIFQMDMLAQ